MWSPFGNKTRLVGSEEALPGREERPFDLGETHFVNGNSLFEVPPEHEVAFFGMGCFWGAERVFWQLDGVWSTAVGYQGGFTPHPTYREVCSTRTGHTEAVRVVYDPSKLSYEHLLKAFWESHDPTQGMRQGNDVGTQYRSAIFTTTESQAAAVTRSRESYQARLQERGHGAITTEIGAAPVFFFAEDYHQQYLAKNPGGYCGMGGTGVSCPVGGQ